MTDTSGAAAPPTAPAPAGAVRTGPRRPLTLPNARAVVGALLVVAAAVIALSTTGGSTDVATTPYLVTTRAITAGKPVDAGAVALVPLALTPEVSARAVTSLTGVAGAVALRDLPDGTLVTVDDLVAAPDVGGQTVGAVHEVTLPVPVDRSPASLLPGERVTVLATIDDLDRTETVVAVADAVVVDHDTRRDDLAALGTAVLTLALERADEAATLVHLTRVGEVTVVRTTRAPGDTWPARVTLDDPPALTGPVAGAASPDARSGP